MSLAAIVLLPFLGAVLPPLLARTGRDTCTIVTALATATALAGLLVHAPAVLAGDVVAERWPWLPQLGLDASFFLDPLGLLFVGLILGIGLLIIVYARFYLAPADPFGQFMSYLLLFQGSMVGIVLAENILLLVVFWELTSLTSFLLIGYWRGRVDARQGARMALVVTGSGGLALLAGALLLGHVAGSFELREILARRELVQASPLYLPILLLVLAGAFTKSAQFPFHFWLPHAMAAPTPVSAYLHSATMVKAGLFLMARLWPVLAGTEAWFLIVSAVGLATMAIAAWIAIFKDDLKALLAFSTVSQLGLVTMLLGLGTPEAAFVAVFHILNHATFKAALFMSAGIVEHETGTRDLRRLGGLASAMPITATLAIVASASMAGLPPLNGFLSKELMLEAAALTTWAGSAWLFPVVATAGALCSVAYAARFAVGTFLGAPRADHHGHDPGPGFWLPVAVLVVPVILIGLFPEAIAGPLVRAVTGAVTGAAPPAITLKLWHGLTPALAMSAVAIVLGIALAAAHAPVARLRAALPRPEAKPAFDAAVAALARGAAWAIARLQNGSLPDYLAAFVTTVLVAGTVAFLSAAPLAAGTRAILPVTPVALVAWAMLVFAAVATVRWHGDRLTGILLTSVVGLVVSLAFLQLSAPDLGLTQISVEVVTTILLLLALAYLPKTTPREQAPLRRLRDGVLAVGAGLGVTGLLYAVLTRDFTTIADYYLATTKPLGGGYNAVNVVIVDYRGYDTFGEIIVLGIAALTIVALLDTALRGDCGRRLAAWPTPFQAAEAHPLVLVVATRVLLPFALVVAFFIYLRGHNEPGGGFVAGLVIAIALLMQYLASGYGWAARRLSIDYHVVMALGVAIAGATGIAAWLAGAPFLTSAYAYPVLPIIGEVGLASAMAFDLGVALTVVGVIVLALAGLARIGEVVEPRPALAEDRAFDVELEPEPRPAVPAAAG
jgi:multicomponent K+:H+ antiporter subunit A